LSRTYEVATATWIESTAFAALVEDLYFPKVLFDIPQIANKLAYYNLFRCKGVKISFRLNTTPYHYGALIASHVAGYGSTTTADPLLGKETAVHVIASEQLFNNHPIVISAMTAETIEMTIPWDFPMQWINPHTVTADGRESIIARVFLSVLSVLRMAAASVVPITVTTFASFVDPEVTSMVAIAQNKGKGKHGKKTNTKEAEEKSGPLTQILGEGAAALEGVGSVVSSVISGVEAAVPFVESIAGMLMLLDKPTTLQAPMFVVPGQAADTYHGYGSANSINLSLRPDAQTLTDEQLSTCGLKPTISSIIQTPAFHSTASFNSIAGQGIKIGQWRVSANEWAFIDGGYLPTYMGLVSSMFAYWRGSINYTFYFFASKFTSARVRLSFQPGLETGVATSPGGDVMSRVIDITGDTKITVNVPYVSDSLWRASSPVGTVLGPSQSTGVLQLEVVNPIVSVTGIQTVDIAVFVSAGADMQFSQFLGARTSRVPKTATTQSYVRDDVLDAVPIVEGSSHYQIIGFADSEQYDDYLTLGKRLTPDPDIAPLGTNTAVIRTDICDTDGAGIPFQGDTDMLVLLAMFKWVRGGIRHRMTFDPPATAISYTPLQSKTPYIANGMEMTASDITIPYWNRVVYQRALIRHADVPVTCTVLAPATSKIIASQYALGDDFGVSGLFSPPLLIARPITLAAEDPPDPSPTPTTSPSPPSLAKKGYFFNS